MQFALLPAVADLLVEGDRLLRTSLSPRRTLTGKSDLAQAPDAVCLALPVADLLVERDRLLEPRSRLVVL